MNAIIYNCCSAAKPFRLPHILQTLDADILMLTGMRYRCHTSDKAAYQTKKIGKYTGYIWGYGQGSLTNKSAGVGIFLTRKIQERHVKVISSPDAWLQGRAGMVRCKSAKLDITVVVAYPPPDMGKKQKTQAASETMKWVREKLREAPMRTTPIVGCDSNGIAAGGTEGTGCLNLSTQGTGGTECLKIVNDFDMLMPGTLWKEAGPTYYPAFGNATTPDH